MTDLFTLAFIVQKAVNWKSFFLYSRRWCYSSRFWSPLPERALRAALQERTERAGSSMLGGIDFVLEALGVPTAQQKGPWVGYFQRFVGGPPAEITNLPLLSIPCRESSSVTQVLLETNRSLRRQLMLPGHLHWHFLWQRGRGYHHQKPSASKCILGEGFLLPFQPLPCLQTSFCLPLTACQALLSCWWISTKSVSQGCLPSLALSRFPFSWSWHVGVGEAQQILWVHKNSPSSQVWSNHFQPYM